MRYANWSCQEYQPNEGFHPSNNYCESCGQCESCHTNEPEVLINCEKCGLRVCSKEAVEMSCSNCYTLDTEGVDDEYERDIIPYTLLDTQ